MLGFSRSEKNINKKILLRKSSSVYNLVDDDDTNLDEIEEITEDIQETTTLFSFSPKHSKKRNLCLGVLLAVIAIISFTIAGRIRGGDYTNTTITSSLSELGET